MSEPRKLNRDEALADALAAFTERHEGERLHKVDFGTYASHVIHVGGGTWWRVVFIREANDDGQKETLVSERAARLEIIRTWREHFTPEPEPADLRQPEAT